MVQAPLGEPIAEQPEIGDVEMRGPTPKKDATGSGGDEREEAVEQEVGITSRGESMDVDEMEDERLLLWIRKRKRGDDDYEDDKDTSGDKDGYEAYLEQLCQTVPQKRRWMTPLGEAVIRGGDDRASYPSPTDCNHCSAAEEECFTFVLPSQKRERRRTACTRCYRLKKKCNFNLKPRRKSRTPAVKTDSDSEFLVEEDEEDTKGTRRGRKWDKGKRRASDVKMEDDGTDVVWEDSKENNSPIEHY